MWDPSSQQVVGCTQLNVNTTFMEMEGSIIISERIIILLIRSDYSSENVINFGLWYNFIIIIR